MLYPYYPPASAELCTTVTHPVEATALGIRSWCSGATDEPPPTSGCSLAASNTSCRGGPAWSQQLVCRSASCRVTNLIPNLPSLLPQIGTQGIPTGDPLPTPLPWLVAHGDAIQGTPPGCACCAASRRDRCPTALAGASGRQLPETGRRTMSFIIKNISISMILYD